MKYRFSIQYRLMITGLMLCLGAGRLLAQTVELIIEPPIVQLGQVATAEFRIRGVRQASAPQLPDMDGLDFNYRGSPVKINTVNGRTDQFIAHQYTIIPLKAGEYSIGPFSYKIGNTTYGVPEKTLKVVSQGGQEIDWESMLFMKMETATHEMYVGQTIQVDFSLYSRVGLQLDGRITPQQLPTAGVTIKEMNELPGRREQIEGQDFQVRRFRIAFQILTAGTFTFAPEFTVNVLMKTQQASRRRSIWDVPYGSMSQVQRLPITLSPDPILLKALNPPTENRPADYEGAVGTFRMNATVKPRSLAVGEPVTLQTIISGQGNVESITAPNVNPGAGFRVYDSKMISSDLNRPETAGRKIFEQVIIPRTEADTIIPALTFSYFDPEAGDYVTLREGPFELELTASPDSEKALVVGSSPRNGSAPVDVLNQDIAYIKSDPGEWRDLKQNPLGHSPGLPLWVHGVASGLIFAGAAAFKTLRFKPRDPVQLRRMSAPENARKGLQNAKALLRAGKEKESLQAVYTTVSDFASDLFNWSPGEFDPARLSRTLSQQDLDPHECEKLIAVLHAAETLRYGGDAAGPNPTPLRTEDVDEIGLILTRIERAS